MKKFSPAFFFLFLAISASSQKDTREIRIGEAKDNIGETVRVCAKIFEVTFHEDLEGSPTRLHPTADNTNSPLTFIIWGEKRKNFDYKPEKDLKNRDVCITGKIGLLKDKPVLVIERQSQIDIK